MTASQMNGQLVKENAELRKESKKLKEELYNERCDRQCAAMLDRDFERVREIWKTSTKTTGR